MSKRKPKNPATPAGVKNLVAIRPNGNQPCDFQFFLKSVEGLKDSKNKKLIAGLDDNDLQRLTIEIVREMLKRHRTGATKNALLPLACLVPLSGLVEMASDGDLNACHFLPGILAKFTDDLNKIAEKKPELFSEFLRENLCWPDYVSHHPYFKRKSAERLNILNPGGPGSMLNNCKNAKKAWSLETPSTQFAYGLIQTLKRWDQSKDLLQNHPNTPPHVLKWYQLKGKTNIDSLWPILKAAIESEYPDYSISDLPEFKNVWGQRNIKSPATAEAKILGDIKEALSIVIKKYP